MRNYYEEIRAALDAAGIDVAAAVLDRVAAVAAGELQVASRMPRLATISGAEWVTIKARPDGAAETVGSLKRGAGVMVGMAEGLPGSAASPGLWRPVYGMPVGWISANLVTIQEFELQTVVA